MIRIDLLLQGGLRGGQLTELVGPSPSGKTQVRDSIFLSSMSKLQIFIPEKRYDTFTFLSCYVLGDYSLYKKGSWWLLC